MNYLILYKIINKIKDLFTSSKVYPKNNKEFL